MPKAVYDPIFDAPYEPDQASEPPAVKSTPTAPRAGGKKKAPVAALLGGLLRK